MGSMNKVILVGHLGADPELRYLDGGKALCRLSVATNRVWTDAQGQRQEQTDWHRVMVWGKTGERCRDYLRKGRRVCVEGRLHERSYQDKEGKKRYATEVVTESVIFLDGPRNDNTPAGGEGRERSAPSGTGRGAAPPMDELPF